MDRVDFDYVTLLLARNRCGANLPVDELLHRFAFPALDFARFSEQPEFETKISAYIKQLTDEGYGAREKAKLLHEAGLPIVYGILTDTAQPAVARLRAHELLGDAASPPAAGAAGGAAPGSTNVTYQLVINLPGAASQMLHGTAPASLPLAVPALPTAASSEEEAEAAAYIDE